MKAMSIAQRQDADQVTANNGVDSGLDKGVAPPSEDEGPRGIHSLSPGRAEVDSQGRRPVDALIGLSALSLGSSPATWSLPTGFSARVGDRVRTSSRNAGVLARLHDRLPCSVN